MDTRREFLKKATLLSGAAGIWNALPESIQAALAIDPPQGSTYLDAEHIVVLMQENRSFDHCYGTLRGVRGFNDPRAITLPDGNPVWLQSNAAGETYAPFRLNIKESKATWMGSLPHSWSNQIDARNHGAHNGWLDAKRSGHPDYRNMPLTMGYYTREDIPFYYALADAFTVCDQHFCSSLTGTTPNRLYLWTGTIREQQNHDSPANVRNEDVDYGKWARWTTFPERLEDNSISWRIYQNELSVGTGLEDEYDSWLTNFTDNPIEWFAQYNVEFAKGHYADLIARREKLRIAVAKQRAEVADAAEADKARGEEQLKKAEAELHDVTAECEKWTAENFAKLSQREQNLHAKAFTTNSNDPDYHKLVPHTYQDGDTERTVQVPAGDVLHQFRQDVETGALPTVSWIVAPENFSDHPGAAWYGAWYVSEVLDILTKNPEVWKKTLLILTYDENDGYFDHVPPFTAPYPDKPETGRASAGIDLGVEQVDLEQDKQRTRPEEARGDAIGLGFRVPLVIASPWSRGGSVCSQVFDHTSVIQFIEHFLAHKTGKHIEESNISRWRRTVCGDLTSVFRPYNGETFAIPPFPPRDTFIEQIHKARFKRLPTDFEKLTGAELEQARHDLAGSRLTPRQEPGTRPASPIPYELYAETTLAGESAVKLSLHAGTDTFGKRSAGAPFNVYALGTTGDVKMRTYAVAAGDALADEWPLDAFQEGAYRLRIYGPNGYFREHAGSRQDPHAEIRLAYARAHSSGLSGAGELVVINRGAQPLAVHVTDNAYRSPAQRRSVSGGATAHIPVETAHAHGWYDFTVTIEGAHPFERRYAGHVETGRWSSSDPAMAGVSA